MDLKLCPSCGQSVLDDEAQVCPFCGGAMDGSDKTARRPAAGKPAAAPRPPAGAADAPAAGTRRAAAGGGSAPGTSGSKPESRPVQGGIRSGKPTVDEDDPFGLGQASPAANVIQALEKPEKGHLLRVVCPMCEKPGFVAKSAVGKQVRCANPKCMVPIFTVPDPDAPPTDRVPKRRTPVDSEPQPRGGRSGKPRSPLMIYLIGGSVLLLAGGGLAWYLNQPPAQSTDLSQPVAMPQGGYGESPEEQAARLAAEEAAARAKAAAAQDPRQDVERYVRRMIQTARQTANRDKAFARRLTADVYLRLNQPTLAAQEFSQLQLVSRQESRQADYYQIEPRLGEYWRRRAAGDAAAAKAAFEQILKDAATIPQSGRTGLEAAMGVAAALVAEGRQDEASRLIQKYQRDRTVILNQDAMSSAAWFLAGTSLRSAGREPLAVVDVFAWWDPLRTAVAADLAARRHWQHAVRWTTTNSDKAQAADSLAIIAELAAAAAAPDQELAGVEAAAAAVDSLAALRVRAVIAAEKKSAERLQAVSAAVAALQPGTPLSLPAIDKVLRLDLPEGSQQRLAAAALTEYVRAAVVCGDTASAENGLRKLTATLFELAPPAADVRRAVQELESREGDVRRRITSELRITSETEVTTAFRNYRRKLDQLATAAERRRLLLIQKLSRVVRAGGAESVQKILQDNSAGLREEVLVDELAGLLAAAAARTGKSLPEVETLDPALRVALPGRTQPLHEIRIGPLMLQAWNLTRQGQLPGATRLMSLGSTDLPGLREAILNELVLFVAQQAEQPDPVYVGIGQIANPVWREEALTTAGRIFALRGLQSAAEKWIEAQSRMPSTEQVTAFYGLALGLIERTAQPTPAAAGPDTAPRQSGG